MWSIGSGSVGAVVYLGGELCKTVSVAVVPDVPTSSSFAFKLRLMGVVTLVVVAAKEITLLTES